MANYLAGNLQFVDTDGVIFDSAGPVKVSYIVFYAETSNAHVELKDAATGSVLMKIGAQPAHNTLYLDFNDRPLVFPRGIEIDNLTNGKLTLVIRKD